MFPTIGSLLGAKFPFPLVWTGNTPSDGGVILRIGGDRCSCDFREDADAQGPRGSSPTLTPVSKNLW